MSRTYRVISGDSHLEVSTDRWVHRVAAEYRDRTPRRIRLPQGGDAHVGEGQPIMIEPVRVTGEYRVYPFGGTFGEGGNPGSGSPQQRLQEQDQDGVDAEVLYPGSQGPNFWRGVKDDNAYKAIVRGYNDWVGEEYCSVDRERLLGLGLIPETGVNDAIAEMEHCLKMGLPGVALNAFPSGKMYPTDEDDRFWAAAIDMRAPLTVHVDFQGFAGKYAGPYFQYPRKFDRETYSAGRDIIGRYANYYTQRGARDAIRLVMAGVFDRFPTLKVYFAENQVGWIPHWLEQADSIYERNHRWAVELLGLTYLKNGLPSEYIREHCLWGFQYNPVGVKMRHLIGVDKIMWASDFPHTETDWPNSRRTIELSFKDVPAAETQQMLAGNCIEFFHLDATAAPHDVQKEAVPVG